MKEMFAYIYLIGIPICFILVVRDEMQTKDQITVSTLIALISIAVVWPTLLLVLYGDDLGNGFKKLMNLNIWKRNQRTER